MALHGEYHFLPLTVVQQRAHVKTVLPDLSPLIVSLFALAPLKVLVFAPAML